MPRVLVTGATGRLGVSLVRALTTRGAEVVAVVRARGGQPGALRASLAGLSCRVLEVDLAGALAPLAGESDAVVHAAAEHTTVPRDPRAQRRLHVEASATLLRVTRPKTFVYLSTLAVVGDREGRILEDEGDVGQSFLSALAESKLAGELLVAAEGARVGVDVRVTRLAGLVGGGASPWEQLAALVADTAWKPRYARSQLRIPGQRQNLVHLAPLDWAAEATAALALAGGGGTVHLRAGPVTQEALFSCLAERYAFPGLRVTTPRRGSLSQPTRLESQALARLGDELDELRLHREFDDQNARALLVPIGVPSPPLQGSSLVSFVDALVG